MTELRTLGRLTLEPGLFTQPKPLVLLAYLALEGPQQRRHMAELLWPAGQSLKSLAMALSRLRRAAPLSWEAEGGRLRCTADCDAVTFLTALDAGDLATAETLYRGPFLADPPQPGWGAELEGWALATRERLAERYRARLLAAAEQALADELPEAAANLAATAQRLSEAPPAGAALLRRIHHLLEAGHHALASEVAAGLGELAAGAPRPQGWVARLAADLFATPFLGRQQELASVAALLERPTTRLLTLLGPDGAGKTRLALRAAQAAEAGESFPGGVHVVMLADQPSPELLTQRLAEAVGVPALPGEEPWRHLGAAIGGRRTLLLLDGLAPSPAAAEALTVLLDQAPGLCILLTSSESLGSKDERVVAVNGLPLPPPGASWEESLRTPAVRLLHDRALASQPDLKLVSQAAGIQRLCRALDGLPLALELAAGWLRSLPAAELAGRVEQTAERLASPSGRADVLPVGLQAMIEVSWRMLDREEQEAMAGLAVFVGGFRREAAEAVADTSLRILSGLLDRSWLRVSARGRLDLHPPLHAFAQRRLAELPQATERRSSHASWFAELARRAEAGRRGPDQVAILRQIADERANLLAALDNLATQDPLRGLALATDLAACWSLQGQDIEGLRQLRRFLDLSEAVDAPGTASKTRASLRIAQLSEPLGEEERAGRLYGQVLGEAEALEDLPLQAETLVGLSHLRQDRGDHAGALRHAEAALRRARLAGERPLMCDALRQMGTLLTSQGALQEAVACLEEAALLAERGGDLRAEAEVSLSLATVMAELRERGRARWLAERSLESFRKLGYRRGEAEAVALLDEGWPTD